MKKLLILATFVIGLSCKQKNENQKVEQHRPLFHFTPPKGWMNDPNGLVYLDGEYHLFYQHNPDKPNWGPMHWGHAISTDLVSWQHQPIALYPDSLGYIFSGSIVADVKNTSGFGDGKNVPLVAIFTYHNMEFEKAGRIDRESQGIAYSLDKGRTWTKYAQNPVLNNKGDQDFRDPKVFWHEGTNSWIMPLAVGDHLELFGSDNLKNWKKLSDFGKTEGAHGGVWECPDFFALKTAEGKEKWVLIQNIGRGAVAGGSGTQYFVGSFDGKTFVNDNKPETQLWLDYGADNYAGVTWFGAPDNRRILIGWMSNWDDYAGTVPTSTWRSGMTVPRELSLTETAEGFRINQVPVKELEALRESSEISEKKLVDSDLNLSKKGVLKEILVEIDPSKTTAESCFIALKNSKNEVMKIGVDFKNKQLFTDKTKSGKTDFSAKFAKIHTAPLGDVSKTIQLRLLIDVASVEVFANEGRVAMTELFFPNEDFQRIDFQSVGGVTALNKATVWSLKGM